MSDTPKGSRWREVETGRVIEIFDEEVHGTGPSWGYVDRPLDPGNWHYCFADDFMPYRKRFERIVDPAGIDDVRHCEGCGSTNIGPTEAVCKECSVRAYREEWR